MVNDVTNLNTQFTSVLQVNTFLLCTCFEREWYALHIENTKKTVVVSGWNIIFFDSQVNDFSSDLCTLEVAEGINIEMHWAIAVQ